MEKVIKLVLSMMQTNCYLIKENGHVLIVDPASSPNRILSMIEEDEVVDGILLTHGHFDHIGALDDIVNKYNVLVYDRYNMNEGINKIDKFNFNVIYTPGHKEDCISIYFREYNVIFCGDFIFKDSIGRIDLPGGNINDMIESINKIKMYDRDVLLYPGHGEYTRIGYEIDNNMYFRDITLL